MELLPLILFVVFRPVSDRGAERWARREAGRMRREEEAQRGRARQGPRHGTAPGAP
ncbi:MAG TPA: hypothetical protein VLA21_03565 [Candidatus Limnocylindria bacterium]|nr:hypothetical protein [Candidatus Limnocylindria bacterium]